MTMRRYSNLRPALAWGGSFGAVVLLWQCAALVVALPGPLAIMRRIGTDGPALYWNAGLATLRCALPGWAGATVAAALCALPATMWPVLAPGLFQLGVMSYCLPSLAIGPVLMIVLDGDGPRIMLAALASFFTMLVGTMTGLRACSPSQTLLVTAFGGTALQALLRVRLRAALPAWFAALRISAPASVLGAMVGEFLGAEHGLGVLLINAQQSLDLSRTCAVTLVSAAFAGVLYAGVGIVGHACTHWARDMPLDLARDSEALRAGWTAGPNRMRVLLHGAGRLAGTTVLALGAWWLVLRMSGVTPYVGRSPYDVLLYLTDGAEGPPRISAIAGELGITLQDMAAGLVGGIMAGLVLAMCSQLWPPLHRLLAGPVFIMQAIPLIATTPLLILLFGRGEAIVVTVGTIVTFFPVFVTVSQSFAQTPRTALALIAANGGGRVDALRRVQLPAALPSIFAALRIAAPLAMTGALIAEWLATGRGMGYMLLNAVSMSDYDGLWARVTVTTTVSMILYGLVGLGEAVAMRALTGGRDR
ncbi:ABC transporter permease [Komagataeibacter oboediens]|uniref:ABC transporter permease n=1 Tax=Komagataeibacter oboediens TaxID=65958 RepID=UPI001C2DB7D9|nr:ABC transporter permease subunit [Komagataeibacter oboediens]